MRLQFHSIGSVSALCDVKGYRLAGHYEVAACVDNGAVLHAVIDEMARPLDDNTRYSNSASLRHPRHSGVQAYSP